MKQVLDPIRKTSKLYQPECYEDCQDINCLSCIFDKYRSRGDNCPFQRWITDYPVEKPTISPTLQRMQDNVARSGCRMDNDTDAQVQAKKYQKYEIKQDIIRGIDIRHERVYIPNNAIQITNLIISPGDSFSKYDLIHIITWLEPIE